MHIIVTTPKSEMKNAAQEAADCLAAGGGHYFRRFPLHYTPQIAVGERVYYVEDGFIRGFAIVGRTQRRALPQRCNTTGRAWLAGFYVFMDATTWTWIRPVRMRGFQGFRYAEHCFEGHSVEVLGGWRDPKPPTSSEKGLLA